MEDIDFSEDTNYVAEKPTYIVSGCPRSGTSMMMRALMTGGLETAYTKGQWKEQQKESRRRKQENPDWYDPNPNGYFELTNGVPRRPEFPRMFEGQLIKVLYRFLPALASGGKYKIVWMLRDPVEIKASFDRMNGNNGGIAIRNPGWKTPEEYYNLKKNFMALVDQRPDMEFIQVWYNDVIADPKAVFERIATFLPIDPAKAAATVDPALYRNRAEKTKGS